MLGTVLHHSPLSSRPDALLTAVYSSKSPYRPNTGRDRRERSRATAEIGLALKQDSLGAALSRLVRRWGTERQRSGGERRISGKLT